MNFVSSLSPFIHHSPIYLDWCQFVALRKKQAKVTCAHWQNVWAPHKNMTIQLVDYTFKDWTNMESNKQNSYFCLHRDQQNQLSPFLSLTNFLKHQCEKGRKHFQIWTMLVKYWCNDEEIMHGIFIILCDVVLLHWLYQTSIVHLNSKRQLLVQRSLISHKYISSPDSARQTNLQNVRLL